MKSRILLALIAAFMLLIGTAGDSLAQNQRTLAEARRITGDNFTVMARTPKGANVMAVRQPSAAMLSAIDRGLTELFAVSRKNGYSRRLSFPEYTIYIGKADRTKDASGTYSPDIAVGASDTESARPRRQRTTRSPRRNEGHRPANGEVVFDTGSRQPRDRIPIDVPLVGR